MSSLICEERISGHYRAERPPGISGSQMSGLGHNRGREAWTEVTRCISGQQPLKWLTLPCTHGDEGSIPQSLATTEKNCVCYRSTKAHKRTAGAVGDSVSGNGKRCCVKTGGKWQYCIVSLPIGLMPRVCHLRRLDSKSCLSVRPARQTGLPSCCISETIIMIMIIKLCQISTVICHNTLTWNCFLCDWNVIRVGNQPEYQVQKFRLVIRRRWSIYPDEELGEGEGDKVLYFWFLNVVAVHISFFPPLSTLKYRDQFSISLLTSTFLAVKSLIRVKSDVSE